MGVVTSGYYIVRDSIISHSGFSSGVLYLKNTIIRDCSDYAIHTTVAEADNVVLENNYGGVWIAANRFDMGNTTFHNNSVDIRMDFSGVGDNVNFTNCKFDDNIPRFGTFGGGGLVWLKYTHSYLVQNSSGVVPNAVVNIYNRSGVLIFSGLSDTFGFCNVTLSSLNVTSAGLNWQTPFTTNVSNGAEFVNYSFNNTLQPVKEIVFLKTPLNISVNVNENLVNTMGTYVYSYNPLLGFTWWLNYTGIGGGSSSGLVIDNPSPGYNSTVVASASGQNTCLNVNYENFTNPPKELPGNHTKTIMGEVMTDVCIYNSSTNHFLVFDNNTGTLFGDTGVIGQTIVGSDYYIYRSYVLFNTSILQDNSIINNATLQLYGSNDLSTTDFNVTIQKCVYPSFHNPLISFDYNRDNYTDDLGSTNSTEFISDGVFNIHLNTLGISEINKTDATKFMLRSNRDINNVTPSDNELLIFWFYTIAPPPFFDGDLYPRLIIDYTIPNDGDTWNHIVNLTWYSNSSGSWQPYGVSYVVANGTVCMLDPNMTGADSWYWNYSATVNGSLIDAPGSAFMFNTANENVVIPSVSNMAMNITFGVSIGIIGFIMAVYYIGSKKKEDDTAA